MKEFEAVGSDVDQDADWYEVWEKGSSTITHEGQGYSNDRHQTQRHPDIYEKINDEHECYAQRQNPPEVVLGLSCRIKPP